jgi:energy-coupling factor transporter ATP-binding protein EcfA2
MTEIIIKKHQNKTIPLGSVISLIGTRGSGKSISVKNLCYQFRNVPRFHVVSKTEKNNKFFSPFIPPSCIHYSWDEQLLPKLFITQDALIEKYGKNDNRSHLVLILDDCLCDKKIWKQPELVELFLNGRHKNITFIFTLQYPIGISPELRGNIDFVYIYGQESTSDKKKIFDHYVGAFDNFKDFKSVLDATTEDYSCMVINRKAKTNEITKKIFRYKAPLNVPVFKAGSPIFWDESEVDMENKTISNGNLTIRFTD